MKPPHNFRERFTIRVDSSGTPLRRCLDQMTAREVFLAARLIDLDVMRLREKVDAATEANEPTDALRDLVEMLTRGSRLLGGIVARCPPEYGGDDVDFWATLPQWWLGEDTPERGNPNE